MGFEPRPYQQEAINETFKYIEEGGKAGLCVSVTGTGKTVLVADTIKRFIQDNPRKKIIVLSHVKEIIEQDFKGLKFHWPSAPAGVYSASIGRRQFNLPIIFGSIQSCYRRPELFKNFDGILVDEAHLVSDKAETMYVRFINHLKESRPDLFLIGYTATPYRLGMGYLTSGPMFDDIFYDNSTMEKFTQLIDDGYLSNIVTMSTEEQFDVTGVKRIGGDFSEKELDAKLNLERITQSVVSETVKMAKGRKKGIAFCISVDHAINMARIFNEHEGYRAQYVHGAMANAERDEVMNKFRNGEINMLTNVGVATTGLDVPDIDYIVLARPTESTALYQQMVGRGLRIHPDKKDCIAEGQLVLTDKGLVPIEEVTLDHKLWDGIEWVSHEGVICKGEQEVIEYEGLIATPDHKCWTKEGWKTLGELEQGKLPLTKTGDGERPIKLSEGD